jgi:hypothetical protein
MVMQRRDPEHPERFSGLELGDSEHAHLDDDRHRDDHEQAAEQDQQQFGPGDDGQAGQRAAEGERAGVAHEDLGGRRVPPQEAEAGAHHGRRDHRRVQRVADVIAVRCQSGGAVVAVLPVADDHVGGEDQDRRARGEAVKAVGEVHPVGGAGHHQQHPDHEQDRADGDAEVGQERDVLRGRGEVVAVRVVQREHREDDADRGLAQQLGAAAQAEAAAHEQLDVVVGEADQAEAGHQEQHQQAGGGHRVAGEQVPAQVADQRRDDDDDAAHGGGAALGRQMGLDAVGPDLLAEFAFAEHGDDRAGA